jgi:hypothetical protein
MMFVQWIFWVLKPQAYTLLMVLFLVDLFLVSKKAKVSEKIFWIAIVLLVPIIGLLIYIFAGRKKMLGATLANAPVAQHAPHPTSPAVNVQPGEQAPAQQIHQVVVATEKSGWVSPQQVKTAATITGTLLAIIASIMGIAAVGFIILIAVVMYQCSQPGAKCM